MVKRAIYIANATERMKAEADSSVDWLLSSECNKLLFGRSSVEIFKIQAGLRMKALRKEFSIRVTPSRLSYSTMGNEQLNVVQTLQLRRGKAIGFTRTLRITNPSSAPLRLRMITVHDPTSLNFRRESDPPAEIGVNAFNRGGHVVMDDAGDTAGVRVIGTKPSPSMIFMTKERQRAADLISSGELPDKTEGMSGAIVIMTQHDLDLSPRSFFDVTVASVYHPSKLEDALIEYSQLGGSGPETEEDPVEGQAILRSSSSALDSSFAWAKASMVAMDEEEDLLDGLSSSFARGLLSGPDSLIPYERAKSLQRKDGSLPHSQDPSERGILETSYFVIQASSQLLLRNDKRLGRRLYPSLKKAADSLSRSLKEGLIACDPSSALPQGWRRRLRSGFPSGTLTEINLAAARALRDFASLAYSTGKGVDAARYREVSERILVSVNQRLRDPESGIPMLCIDPLGRPHREITIDQAVALSYLIPDVNAASSIVHRLLEKDFETGYGPRCVPSSNPICYNTYYGEGQLGAYWTRGAIAHALLAYLSGHAGIGSMQLEKIAKLVESDSERMGGIPGEFPLYLDPEKRLIIKEGSDPVAAARFFEAVLLGELGLTIQPSELLLRPPKYSQLKWLSLHHLELATTGSVFVGRGNETTYLATSFSLPALEETLVLKECERLSAPNQHSEALLFHTPYQLLCVGTHANSSQSLTVSVPLRERSLAKSLSAELEELDPDAGRWTRTGRIKLTERMPIRVELKPFGWKFLKFSQITS